MIARLETKSGDLEFSVAAFAAEPYARARMLINVVQVPGASMRAGWFCSAEAARAFAKILTEAADKLDAAQVPA
jgi:hypothetical protein